MFLRFLFYSCVLIILAEKTYAVKSRIINGNNTSIESNPWQVSLQLFGKLLCGGTIIAPNVVLTAAHCIPEKYEQFLEVLGGTSNLLSGGTRISVANIIIHENYSEGSHDAAILILSKNFEYSKKIQPAILSQDEPPVGSTAKITGWGSTNVGNGKYSPDLLIMQETIIDRRTCSEKYSDIVNANIDESMICAQDLEKEQHVCSGDSGGPLTVNGIVYGILSWGSDCHDFEHPTVYTNVALIHTWIKAKAAKL